MAYSFFGHFLALKLVSLNQSTSWIIQLFTSDIHWQIKEILASPILPDKLRMQVAIWACF